MSTELCKQNGVDFDHPIMAKNSVFLISFVCDWLAKVNTSSPYLLSSENIYFAAPLVNKPHSTTDHKTLTQHFFF